MTDTDPIEAVRNAIAAHEDDCNNEVIDEATGYEPGTVDAALERLWLAEQIEGILTLGGRVGAPSRNPSLQGIRLVLPGRPRAWGWDGRYQKRP
jgi:hypothetical protein